MVQDGRLPDKCLQHLRQWRGEGRKRAKTRGGAIVRALEIRRQARTRSLSRPVGEPQRTKPKTQAAHRRQAQGMALKTATARDRRMGSTKIGLKSKAAHCRAGGGSIVIVSCVGCSPGLNCSRERAHRVPGSVGSLGSPLWCVFMRSRLPTEVPELSRKWWT